MKVGEVYAQLSRLAEVLRLVAERPVEEPSPTCKKCPEPRYLRTVLCKKHWSERLAEKFQKQNEAPRRDDGTRGRKSKDEVHKHYRKLLRDWD